MAELTVGVTTFNRWDTCLLTLKSLRKQQGLSIEIVLVDDASTDPMTNDVQRYVSDNDIILIKHPNNLGLSAARNSAINRASSGYFSFCDDDDIWPQGLAYKLYESVADGCKGASMAVAISKSRYSTCGPLFGECSDLITMMYQGFTPPVGSQLYEINLLKSVGGYDTKVKSGVDHDLWVSLAVNNPIVSIVWTSPAIACNDPDVVRITTNEDLRKREIARSLDVWKPKIVSTFGDLFYVHFCRSYYDYIKWSFFIQKIKRRRVLDAFLNNFNINIMKRLIILVRGKIFGISPCGNFPLYEKNNK